MRILLEIVLIVFIALVGWRQPFRDAVRERFPQTEVAPSRLARLAIEAEYRRRQVEAGEAGPSNGNWMFTQPGSLDRKPNK